ncbi:MAG: M20/M25/M40 family metallo-hydrolase [Coriobacteriia bacterium]|nr:M20/M25/M40 family metallo-hydrolase [Coriobacteriia bacterium]
MREHSDTTALFKLVEADKLQRKEQLAKLVSYQSLAFPGYDPAQSAECAQLVAALLRDVGFADIEMLDVGGQNPTVWAETRIDDDAPTIFLYAHYDVQPAPLEQGWDSDPWTMIERDGRYFGRGSADDKAGIVQHLSALRALCEQRGLHGVGQLPFNIKVCFEGEEEYGDSLPTYIPKDADRFEADVFLVCDGGNLERGKPILQTTLRGVVELNIEVQTLLNALHSGAFGGPAPDAYLALTRLISSLYDAEGNTVIAGVKDADYQGSADYSDELFRRQAEVPEGIELVGTGSVASRLWTRPAATIVGVDMPNIEESSNIVIPKVSARISLRFPPGQDGAEVLEALKQHLLARVPWGADLSFTSENVMNAFAAGDAGGPYTALMKDCLTEAYQSPCGEAGSGGSIPLLGVLQQVSPEAEFLLFGPIDSELSNIHGANESVCEQELENCTKAEALFMSQLS